MILKSKQADPRVIQCWYNCIALCSKLHLPLPPSGIIKKSDRIFFPHSILFESQCKVLEELGELARWDAVSNHDLDPTDDFPSGHHGWRQTFLYVSAQIVIHTDAFGSPEAVEIDFDFFNPERGLAGAFPHVGEFLYYRIFRTKTNPFRVARVLHRRGYHPNFIRKKDQEWAGRNLPKEV